MSPKKMNPNMFRSHVQCKSRPSHSNKKGKKIKLKHSQYFTKKKSSLHLWQHVETVQNWSRLVVWLDSLSLRCSHQPRFSAHLLLALVVCSAQGSQFRTVPPLPPVLTVPVASPLEKHFDFVPV